MKRKTRLRFDDSLETVLAGDAENGLAAQSAWRQIVDLCGRGRAPFDARVAEKLAVIRDRVPLAIRVASTRPLESALPPAALVGFMAKDDLAVSLPLLRGARLADSEWRELIPVLSPPARSVLRNRRDLSGDVRRSLEAYGPVDMVLPEPVEAANEIASEAPLQSRSFVTVGKVALDMPIVAEAVRRLEPSSDSVAQSPGTFAISDVVARIDAFQRDRERVADRPRGGLSRTKTPEFRFETDRFAVLSWVDGVDRRALVGLSLATDSARQHSDAVIAGALRRRAAFRDARLVLSGESEVSGHWLLSGVPGFDPKSGRFTGFRGTARRPRSHELAHGNSRPSEQADSVRQLVHELRTPANAISGFSEMIEGQMLGPVPDVYRERATVIRQQVGFLIAAIDDLDLAARIESHSLKLSPQPIGIAALAREVIGELEDLLHSRGASIDVNESDARVQGDHDTVERLLRRLLATLVGPMGQGEHLSIDITSARNEVRMEIDRPAGLALGNDAPDDLSDGLLLGADFTLRLVKNLSMELGGSFDATGDRLTLVLPAADNRTMEQAIVP